LTTALVWLAPLLASGCFTEFPPLLPAENSEDTDEDTTGGGAASSGVTGVSSVANPTDGGPGIDGSIDGSSSDVTGPNLDGGSSSSTDSVISCGQGQTACGSTCVVGNSCCPSACETTNAESECRDAQCVITACASDFFDCDGEFDNGCELEMPAMSAPDATEDSPLAIPRFDYEMGIAEIDQTAWLNVPRYKLDRPCPTCESNGRPPSVPPITPSSNRGAVPKASDFRGSFALAWNDLGLWMNVVVIDDQWVFGDDVGETDARLHDNVMLVWDSAEGESDAGSGDDRILFAGVDGELTDWRQASFDQAAVRVLGSGQCRSIHLQLGGEYLFMGSGGSGLFETGDRHGLNVGYNDFDWVQEDAPSAEREHFVFGLEMSFTSGRDYYTGTRTLPQIELIDGP
jgi:hypothetical protein